MTCAAGHQPNLYPYGGFFAKVDAADVFVVVDNTQYVPKEYHNRNRIRLRNGQVVWLTIPVLHRGRFGQRINEVEIVPGKPWARDHRRSLELNYCRTPFFDRYFPELAALLDQEWRLLVDYNLAVIRLMCRWLDIATPLRVASELGIAGQATGLIVDLCHKTAADTYLHGRHSLDYVDFPQLREQGIASRIQAFEAVPYRQAAPGFEPNLATLDLIFNCGTEALAILRQGNASFLPPEF